MTERSTVLVFCLSIPFSIFPGSYKWAAVWWSDRWTEQQSVWTSGIPVPTSKDLSTARWVLHRKWITAGHWVSGTVNTVFLTLLTTFGVNIVELRQHDTIEEGFCIELWPGVMLHIARRDFWKRMKKKNTLSIGGFCLGCVKQEIWSLAFFHLALNLIGSILHIRHMEFVCSTKLSLATQTLVTRKWTGDGCPKKRLFVGPVVCTGHILPLVIISSWDWYQPPWSRVRKKTGNAQCIHWMKSQSIYSSIL